MIPTYNNMETVYPIVTSMISPFRKDVVKQKDAVSEIRKPASCKAYERCW
ncbi:hypothetical protein [Paenibacillus cookii]|uniref:Uncharacterized protein n=1 Tax=Paenibacillus cookii TaxID=157839 RepID=A0ABQ4LTY8_9BACL|nr:hypothetical protein [Paenibacillus cookii]GIO66730.1 hypothetical protein J21TS3_15510 [Paenibacillus cookii]